jgi:hypothetical protein
MENTLNEKMEDTQWTIKPQKDSNENLILKCARNFLKMVVTGLLDALKHGFCLVSTWMLSLKATLSKKMNPALMRAKQKLLAKGNEMLTAMDKGVEAAKLTAPPVGVYEGVDLRILPKFISFKAALLKEKMTLQYLLLIHLVAFGANFCFSRLEIQSLEKKLREKEYILAPGVVDFTTASPQSVPDSYVVNAAMSFVSQLGNINPANIDEQYKHLAEFMSPELRIQFEGEVAEWRETVKTENISEILKVTDREVVASEDGFYKFTALGQRERFTNSESLGHVSEMIEMTLKLVPPAKGKEWYLAIISLKRARADGFKSNVQSSTEVKKSSKINSGGR